jgi:hypothetical protein
MGLKRYAFESAQLVEAGILSFPKKKQTTKAPPNSLPESGGGLRVEPKHAGKPSKEAGDTQYFGQGGDALQHLLVAMMKQRTVGLLASQLGKGAGAFAGHDG